MDFIHRPYQPGETIAAIATPPGEGGIAVIRISGHQAVSVAEKVFSGPVAKYISHTAHFGKVIDKDRKLVDEAILLVMRAPRSYTGEDTVEIHCHGGSLITKKVLDTVLNAGARAALPGEFTFKAYINGKIDLAQAEAVQELIAAQSELALDFAEKQLQGTLSKQISMFQKELVDIAAILEAWVDFPEEDLEFAHMDEVVAKLEDLQNKMMHLLDSFHDGKILHEGLSLCLAGSPNVGKSSLMNALLGKDRAIVTDIPGTTRDVLEEDLRLGPLRLRLIDTAGIRDTEEQIEQEGIRRTKKAMKEADLILLVLDATKPLNEDDLDLIHSACRKKTILIWNKIDVPHNLDSRIQLDHAVKISAKNLLGIDQLRQLIDQVVWKDGLPPKGEIVITNARHKQALQTAVKSCTALIRGLKEGVSPEFVSLDMREVLRELGTIIGTNISEDILSAIFSKFCLGK